MRGSSVITHSQIYCPPGPVLDYTARQRVRDIAVCRWITSLAGVAHPGSSHSRRMAAPLASNCIKVVRKHALCFISFMSVTCSSVRPQRECDETSMGRGVDAVDRTGFSGSAGDQAAPCNFGPISVSTSCILLSFYNTVHNL